jgi:predicted DNA-binding protein (UPF0251 family)
MKKVTHDQVIKINRQLINSFGKSVEFSKAEKEVLRLIGYRELTQTQKRDVVKRSLNEAWSKREKDV